MKLATLMAEQLAYYRKRASQYDATSTPPTDSLAAFGEQQRVALNEFKPAGAVLEIACGTGGWTVPLLRHADQITVLDASPEMLELARKRVGLDHRVGFIHADIFAWEPDRGYDVVFFANWLSHVPPALFDVFWGTVRQALDPAGRVFFVDELDDAWRSEELYVESWDGNEVPIVQRQLQDGQRFRVVKVFWDLSELSERLAAGGWDISVHPSGPFYWGEGRAL